ncbi:MAG: hypothetical protein RLY71_3442 [Pseudomonadota bacterium]
MNRGRFDSLALALLLTLGAGAAGAAEPGVSAAASAPVAASVAAAAASAPSPEFIALQARARTGDPAAEFELAKAIELGQGSGLPRDIKSALPWYEKAAVHHHAEAQSRLGAYHESANQFSQALRWLEKAADQGHARATNKLASMYDFGQGVTKDGSKAIQLYRKAAELGWPEAMWNLANIYGSGRYGETDMQQACIWALRAHTYADPNFPGVLKQYDKRLPLIKHKLGADGMATCRQQAEAWAPRQLPPEVRPVAAAASAVH